MSDPTLVGRPPRQTPARPLVGLVLGYGPVLALLALAIAGWVLPAPWAGGALAAGWLLGSAVLLFLAGVTRGLSLGVSGGPRSAQLAMVLWLFLLGLGALATALAHPLWIGFALLALGYGSLGIYDPQAARVGLAPPEFARTRPIQMGIAVAALMLLFLRAATT